jgi:hypothetical protein
MKLGTDNAAFNSAVGAIANFDEGVTDPRGYGKRVPYIGWYWRPPDFVGRAISIGDCGDFIGVMENNKWGYPERFMTREEADKFIGYLERATSGPDNAAILDACWDWMQTLEVRP